MEGRSSFVRSWTSGSFSTAGSTLRLASKLTDFGYGIETKYKADGKGGKKYFSWDIEGHARFGHQEVLSPDRLRSRNSPTTSASRTRRDKDKLGATSRQFKREDMTLEDYRDVLAEPDHPGGGPEDRGGNRGRTTGQNPSSPEHG